MYIDYQAVTKLHITFIMLNRITPVTMCNLLKIAHLRKFNDNFKLCNDNIIHFGRWTTPLYLTIYVCNFVYNFTQGYAFSIFGRGIFAGGNYKKR